MFWKKKMSTNIMKSISKTISFRYLAGSTRMCIWKGPGRLPQNLGPNCHYHPLKPFLLWNHEENHSWTHVYTEDLWQCNNLRSYFQVRHCFCSIAEKLRRQWKARHEELSPFHWRLREQACGPPGQEQEEVSVSASMLLKKIAIKGCTGSEKRPKKYISYRGHLKAGISYF